ncbi:hypothetical protein [Mesorhizobium delmotii]|uniref:Uncharacterized protein n=1 Tax=Mesorhizobium delmotii TaxID=1631247 RepID=A0A2P9APD9_9HYPH|nr:hypothetical protein [Mesorhizobium delmotii]SJM33017.1 hypothetical protein BQ8482_330152 [Mesorhizobium delmotii]
MADIPGSSPKWTRVGSADEDPEDIIRRTQPPPLTFEEQLAVEVDIVREVFGRDPRPSEMNVLINHVRRRNKQTVQ